MALTLIGNGGIFTRTGLIAGRVNDLLANAGGTTTANIGAGFPVGYNNLQAAFAYSPAWQSLLDNIYASYVAAGQSSTAQLANTLIPVAANLFVSQTNGNVPLLQQTLQYALQQVVTAMQAGPYYVVTSGAAAGAQTGVGSPVGTPTINLSMLLGNGLSLEYAYPETLTFTVTSDQYSGATIYQEPYLITGQTPALNPWQWPGGSGTSITIGAIDATQNYPNGNNLLTNSNFQTATNANIPDNFIALTGTIGTQILCSNSVQYNGGNTLQFVGDGSTLTTVYQPFNATPSTTLGQGGTSYTIVERQPISVNFWIKMSASSPAAGVLKVSLTNGSGTVLNDDAGTANTVTATLTGISDTNWHNYTATFRVPTALPSQVWLKIYLSTALSSGKTVYIAYSSMGAMTPLYASNSLPQGPYCAIHSGNTAPIVNDAWTSAITTSMALNTWQGVMQFFFNAAGIQSITPGIGIRLPTASGGATVINANLIQ